jgi:hypothetical protein
MHVATQTRTPTGHFVWAVLVPIVGAVLAIRAWNKAEIGPGFALMATAALSQGLWLFVAMPALGWS